MCECAQAPFPERGGGDLAQGSPDLGGSCVRSFRQWDSLVLWQGQKAPEAFPLQHLHWESVPWGLSCPVPCSWHRQAGSDSSWIQWVRLVAAVTTATRALRV